MKHTIRFLLLLQLLVLFACQAEQGDKETVVQLNMENLELPSEAEGIPPPPPPEEPPAMQSNIRYVVPEPKKDEDVQEEEPASLSEEENDQAQWNKDQSEPPPPPEERARDEERKDTPASRKIIRQGSLTFETASVAATRQLLLRKVAEHGGYVAQENAYQYDDRIQHQLTLRMPSDKFEALFEQIFANAKKVDQKSVSAQDVTEEFIDIQARLKTKKQLENRYLELLKKAQKVDEILNIEREIGTLRSDIESIEGRLKYLTNQVALGTLHVTYYEKIIRSGGDSKFSQALKGGWQNLTLFVIGVVYLWPFLIVFIALWLVVARFRKNRAKRRAELP